MRKQEKSRELMKQAMALMPGGVNSPVRAFRAVGGDPPVIARAKGAYLHDVDGNRYVDYVGTWGPAILGHADDEVVEAVCAAAQDGTSFGAPTAREVRLARMVIDAVDSVEKVRFVSSGTEATMSALRLARAATGRDRIVKFDGCYHGHGDSLLVKAGSGVETLGLPDSPGVPKALAELTITLPFNDLAAVAQLFAERGEEIACIITEPAVGNMGLILPEDGFLPGLRKLCDDHGVLLILDEVMTGFRVALGGAQQVYGVRPDLTTFGKVIGGGLPVGAYGGRADLMDQVAPSGPVYQAGTLSGNPLAMAAGIATLERLAEPHTYEKLERQSARLAEGLLAAAKDAGVEAFGTRVGSMLGLYFQGGPVRNADDARKSDTAAFGRYHRAMLDHGVYLAPSQFESSFVSLAHDDAAIDQTLDAAAEAFKVVAAG